MAQQGAANPQASPNIRALSELRPGDATVADHARNEPSSGRLPRADVDAARALAAEVAFFHNFGEEIDEAFAVVAERGAELKESAARIHRIQHRLGEQAFPSFQQLDVFGGISARTSFMATPWARLVEMVPPNQRRRFGDLVGVWCATITSNQIAPRLGDQRESEAA